MPVKNAGVVPQWKRNAFGAAVMLGFFGMVNTSSGDSASSVPPTTTNAPAAGNVPRTALNSDPKINSVVFKKKGRSAKKIPDCGSKEPCGSKKYVYRSKRPDEKDVGMGVTANNNSQAAKVKVKVPF